MNPVSPSFGSVTFVKQPSKNEIGEIRIDPARNLGLAYFSNSHGRKSEISFDVRAIEALALGHPAGALPVEQRRQLQTLLTQARQGGLTTALEGYSLKALLRGLESDSIPVNVIYHPLQTPHD